MYEDGGDPRMGDLGLAVRVLDLILLSLHGGSEKYPN